MDPALTAETMAWTHAGTTNGQTRPDGIPADAFGPKHAGRGGVVRDVTPRRPVAEVLDIR